jgi:hypothetical protein
MTQYLGSDLRVESMPSQPDTVGMKQTVSEIEYGI